MTTAKAIAAWRAVPLSTRNRVLSAFRDLQDQADDRGYGARDRSDAYGAAVGVLEVLSAPPDFETPKQRSERIHAEGGWCEQGCCR